MQLEDYFEFEKFETKHGPVERIRIKGHRIAIEHVVELFNQGLSPERIRRKSTGSKSAITVFPATRSTVRPPDPR